jgi:hypothetical protein
MTTSTKVAITTEYPAGVCQQREEDVGAEVLAMTDAEAGRWIKEMVHIAAEKGEAESG